MVGDVRDLQLPRARRNGDQKARRGTLMKQVGTKGEITKSTETEEV